MAKLLEEHVNNIINSKKNYNAPEHFWKPTYIFQQANWTVDWQIFNAAYSGCKKSTHPY